MPIKCVREKYSEQGPRERERCNMLMKERQENLQEGAKRKHRRKIP
jgi:hypothetical protein